MQGRLLCQREVEEQQSCLMHRHAVEIMEAGRKVSAENQLKGQ